jgi:hypothetical protein
VSPIFHSQIGKFHGSVSHWLRWLGDVESPKTLKGEEEKSGESREKNFKLL